VKTKVNLKVIVKSVHPCLLIADQRGLNVILAVSLPVRATEKW
jgi:hypothetical protein